MGEMDEPERGALTVPLVSVGSASPRRARLALAVWSIALVGMTWIGLAGHQGGGLAPATVAPAAAVPATIPPTATATPRAAAVARGTVRYIAASVAARHTLGEDGLVGGIVFGDSIPALTQAEIERDGYRYYQQLLAQD